MKTNYVQHKRSMLDRYVTLVPMDKQFPYVESLYIEGTVHRRSHAFVNELVLSTYRCLFNNDIKCSPFVVERGNSVISSEEISGSKLKIYRRQTYLILVFPDVLYDKNRGFELLFSI